MKLLVFLFEMYEALESLDPQSRVTVNESIAAPPDSYYFVSVWAECLYRENPVYSYQYIFPLALLLAIVILVT